MKPFPIHPPAAECRKFVSMVIATWVWVFFVLLYYFWSIGPALDLIPAAFNLGALPSPVSSQIFRVFGESLFILLVTFFILLATLIWGRQLRLFLGIEASNTWIQLGVNFGFGIIFWDLLWVGSGLTRIWFRPFFLATGLFLNILILGEVIQGFKKFSHNIFKTFPKEPSYIFLLLGGIIYWLFSIAHGLVPETFYDSMVYHLAVPQYWIFQHGISDFPTNFFSNYFYGGELFYLNGLIFQGTESAKMLHAICFAFCAILAGGWVKEIAGEKAGWLTLGLVLTFPLFAINIWSTQVEGGLAFALILFLYFIYEVFQDQKISTGWVMAAGLFMALAFSIKYTAAIMIASSFLAILLDKPHVLKRFNFYHWLVFFAGSFLLVGPWLIKNFELTANPFYPYFMSFFEGRHLTPAAYEGLLTEQRGRIAQGWEWFYLPWKAVMENPDGFNFAGPVALAFLPFLFLFKLRHPVLRFLSKVTVFFFISGFWITHILRFLGTGFILIYILLGGTLVGGNRPQWGKILGFLAAISAIFSFGYLSSISGRYSSCAGIWFGFQNREDYLMSRGKITPYFTMSQWISIHTPPDSRLLVVGDARGLYYERSFLTNTVFDEQVLALLAKEEKDSQGIALRLKQMGIDYLVVNGLEGIRVSSDYHHYDLTSEEWKRLDDFIQLNSQIVYQHNFQIVYRVLLIPQPKETSGVFNLMLFFSKPASEFIKAAQNRQWGNAQEKLNEVIKLYPFSDYWKDQKSDFEKAMLEIQHS